MLEILNKAKNILKKKKWILPDLGAEDYFPYIYKKAPETNVLLLYRNPLESIVAPYIGEHFLKLKIILLN